MLTKSRDSAMMMRWVLEWWNRTSWTGEWWELFDKCLLIYPIFNCISLKLIGICSFIIIVKKLVTMGNLCADDMYKQVKEKYPQ